MAEESASQATSTGSVAATPAKTPTSDGQSVEQVTANDNSLAINRVTTDKQEVDQATAPETDNTATMVPPPMINQPSALPATDSQPKFEAETAPESAVPAVVLSENDIAAHSEDADSAEHLSEQIEVLTGEIQALEAKIERLTSGVSTTESAPKATPITEEEETPQPQAAPPAEKEATPAIEPTKPVDEPEEEIKPNRPVEVTPPPAVPESKVEASKPAEPLEAEVKEPSTGHGSVTDIYSKLFSHNQAEKIEKSDKPEHTDLNEDATIEEGSSGLGLVGEVMAVFGLIVFFALLASPLYKSMLGSNADVLKMIGWPTTAISLTLGFILGLFLKGRVGFKIFSFILMLTTAMMTLAILDLDQYLGPIAPLLDSLAKFYQ